MKHWESCQLYWPSWKPVCPLKNHRYVQVTLRPLLSCPELKNVGDPCRYCSCKGRWPSLVEELKSLVTYCRPMSEKLSEPWSACRCQLSVSLWQVSCRSRQRAVRLPLRLPVGRLRHHPTSGRACRAQSECMAALTATAQSQAAMEPRRPKHSSCAALGMCRLWG